MKKTILAILLILALLANVTAQQDPTDVSQVLGNEFKISPEKIPTDTDDIRQQYLEKEWSQVIANNSFIGPIHRTFENSPTVFRILIGDPYSLSLVFLFIFGIWLFFFIRISTFLNLLQPYLAWAIGLVSTIILAQTGLIRLIAKALTALIQNRESIWLKIIITVIILGAIAFIYIALSLVAKKIKQNKKKAKEEQRDEDAEIIRTIAGN